MPTTALAVESLKDLAVRLHGDGGFAPLTDDLQHGRSGTIDGAWGSSAALATAALALKARSTVLVVIAHPRDLDSWAGDLASFTGTPPVLFPAWDGKPGGLIDEVAGQRLRLLKRLESSDPLRLVITTISALMQPAPDRAGLARNRRVLRAGDSCDPEALASWLVERGYKHAEAVETPGEFSRRGGIVDVFSPDAEAPFRVEFFGDEIESIRQFSPGTQRSLGETDCREAAACGLARRRATPPSATLTGHLCDYSAERGVGRPRRNDGTGRAGPALSGTVDRCNRPVRHRRCLPASSAFPQRPGRGIAESVVETTYHLHVESVERFSGEVGKVRDELDSMAVHDQVFVACHNEAECKRLAKCSAKDSLRCSGRLHLVLGRVRAGLSSARAFATPPTRRVAKGARRFVVLGGQELFRREHLRGGRAAARQTPDRVAGHRQLSRPGRGRSRRPRQPRHRRAFAECSFWISTRTTAKAGPRLRTSGQAEEHLILEFRDGVRLYRPGVEDRPRSEIRRRLAHGSGAVEGRRHGVAASQGQGCRRQSSTWPAT